MDDYNHAVLAGIVKIASKMGISTIQSYQGSQIFEALGMSKEVVDKYFTNTVSRVGGITLQDIAERSGAAPPEGLSTPWVWAPAASWSAWASHKLRSGRDSEQHLYNPLTIHLLQQACWTGDYDIFKQYTDAMSPTRRRRDAPAQPAGIQLSRAGRAH